MNRNHFLISYPGNKRQECEHIFNSLKDNLENIKTIIEPFCGSSAFSFYMSVKFPKRFKYILNDTDEQLIMLYNVLKDENKTKDLIEKLNNLSINMDKEKYNKLIDENTVENYVYLHTVYAIRSGLFPTNRKIKTNFNDLLEKPIINFLRTENITITNINGVELLDREKNNEENLIFIDPPYLMSCNSYYNLPNQSTYKMNVYEYLSNEENNINNLKSYIILVLENNWIINLLFKTNVKKEYSKLYQVSKIKTSHILIDNK